MRTKNPDPPTRHKLLDAAEALMLSKGYVAATVDEICAAAGVTKGSFFHYFKSKEDLAKAALERFSGAQTARFVEACASATDPLDRVYRLIDTAIAGFRDPEMTGCLVGTIVQETSQTHPALREVCECSFSKFIEFVAGDFVKAKALYAPRADFDAQALGNYVLALVQGSMLVFKATGDRSAMEQNLVHLKHYLRALYGR